MLMHGLPATPCCRFHNRFLDESDKEPVDNFNATFADIRETMMRNEWHPGCYKCKADEETKGSSMRTEADEFFDDFTDEFKLEYLEITVGRLCNLACISCGVDFSHKWDDDAIALKIDTPQYITKLKEKQELDLDDLDVTLLKDLKNIKVTGGEPFLHKQFLRFIVRLYEAGLSENIRIEIFTNCTWYPAKVEMDALLSFRQIRITTSIDGIGKVNDVLRYPSKWEHVEATLDKWIEVRDSFGAPYNRKFILSAAPTLNVINAPYMFEFMHWARVHKQIEVVLQTVYEPNYLSITHWPNWFKDKLQFVVDQQYDGFNNRGPKLAPAWKLITKMCKHTQQNEDKSLEYLQELERIFEHRGHTLDDVHRFKRILEFEAKSIDRQK